MSEQDNQTPAEGEVMAPEAATEAQTAAVAPRKSVTLAETPNTNFMNPAVYIQMKAMAADFVKSKAIPKGWDTAEQVLVGMQTGFEMGMQPMESLMSLYPVNGMINIWGKATVRRLKEHGFEIKYENESPESITATIKRLRPGTKGSYEIYTETYTFAEADASGYTRDSYGKLKVGWKDGVNRKLKMRYGVLSFIIKSHVPEVLGKAADIVEVAEDWTLEDAKPDNKTLMAGAEKKRAALQSGKFNPKPGEAAPTEEPKKDEQR